SFLGQSVPVLLADLLGEFFDVRCRRRLRGADHQHAETRRQNQANTEQSGAFLAHGLPPVGQNTISSLPLYHPHKAISSTKNDRGGCRLPGALGRRGAEGAGKQGNPAKGVEPAGPSQSAVSRPTGVSSLLSHIDRIMSVPIRFKEGFL